MSEPAIPSGPRAPFRRATGLALACLTLLPIACRGPGSSVEELRARATPTLEEIFLIPGIHGVPPRARSLSADGGWLLLSWSEEPDGDDGRPSPDAGLRVLGVRDPAATDHRGIPLAPLLPPVPGAEEGEEAERPRRATRLVQDWSDHGARLVVARADEVFLLDFPASGGDPRAARVVRLHADPPTPEEEAGEGDDGEPDGSETGSAPERTGSVRSVSFADDDRRLRLRTSKELFVVPIPETPTGSLLDGEVEWITRDIDVSARAITWSDDLSVGFSADEALGYVPAEQPTGEERTPDDGEEEAEEEERGAAAQILDLRTGRAVVLEGLEDIRWLERTSLSGDGGFVVGHDVDRSDQPEPNLVPDYLTPRVSTRRTRRELADDRVLPRTGWLWDTATGARTQLDFGDRGEEPGNPWLRGPGWAPQPQPDSPARYAMTRLSEDFRDLELWCWSPDAWRIVFRDHDPRWLGGPAGGARWSADGRVLLVPSESLEASTTPGRCQLFAVDPDDGSLRQLTAVRGELSRFVPLADGGVVFTASDEDPARRYLGWIPADVVRGEREAEPTRLRAPAGFNGSPLPSRDGSTVVFVHEQLGRPAELWATRVGSDEPAVQLTDTVPEAFEQLDLVLPEKLQVVDGAGTTVHSHVYLPRSTDLERPDRPRPCVVFIHGAGYLQNVTDSLTEYEVNFLFHSRLAEMGYVVVDVDYRGSRGYGNDFRTGIQHHMGGLDLDDVHLVVDELIERRVIDADRVGAYGGSYGGFLTLMALFTAPERWTCGAALRSVTDWRTYHPGYTQPRLGRPSTHPEAYERSSPLDHAEKLEDPLLILHGLVDANVFAQDSIRLIEKLIDHGLDFDAMLYPSQGHGFRDGMHWLDEYGRIERFLIEHLGPAE